MDDDKGTEDDRVRNALLKALAAVVVIGVVIAFGTTIVVRALGLDESDSPGPVGSAPAEPVEPLPTTAIPVPGQDSEDAEPTEEPSGDATPGAGKSGKIQLDVSPVIARPMERVNLTGTYKGADNLQIQVQRFESGNWTDFGVTANVRVGTFETFVMTGRAGEQRFRMYDPAADQGSNVVLVTID